MTMSCRRSRRPLALFALALVLLAALPCSALAGEASCCGAAARCADASESACAELAATPCCEASGAAVEVSAPAALQDAPTQSVTRIDVIREPVLAAVSYAPLRPCAANAHRSVILRL
jgi:hypothetical protein